MREIDLKRKENRRFGKKIVLYIAMPRHFDKADFLRLREDIQVCSRLRYKRNSKPFGEMPGRLCAD